MVRLEINRGGKKPKLHSLSIFPSTMLYYLITKLFRENVTINSVHNPFNKKGIYPYLTNITPIDKENKTMSHKVSVICTRTMKIHISSSSLTGMNRR